jgi:hypothetical protein
MLLGELGVLVAILRPWSYQKSWGRALGALGACLPLTFFALLLTMHAGSVASVHALWMLTNLMGLVGACLVGVLSTLGQPKE